MLFENSNSNCSFNHLYFEKIDCSIRLKTDYLIRLFNFCCRENSSQSFALRKQIMLIFRFFFSHFTLISLFENVCKSTFRLLFHFRFKFFQSFFERKRDTKIFYVFDRVNDNIRVKINFHCCVFLHSFEI